MSSLDLGTNLEIHDSKIWFLEAKLLFPTMYVSLLLISWTMTMSDAQPGSMDGAYSETDFQSVTCSWRQREESLLEKFVKKNGHWTMDKLNIS